MSLSEKIVGMHYRYPDYYVVGREKVREYATAVKNDDPAFFEEKAAAELGYDTIVAPLTFSAIFALLIQQHLFRQVDIGMETMQIVQVDQKFLYHKPIQAGDRLFGTVYVHSVDERFGADIVVTRNVCENEKGEVVMESFTTLMGQQGDNSTQIKWDAESGQVMRKAVGE